MPAHNGIPLMNFRALLLGLLRQAVYGRLAGYVDVNDASGSPAIPPCTVVG